MCLRALVDWFCIQITSQGKSNPWYPEFIVMTHTDYRSNQMTSLSLAVEELWPSLLASLLFAQCLLTCCFLGQWLNVPCHLRTLSYLRRRFALLGQFITFFWFCLTETALIPQKLRAIWVGERIACKSWRQCQLTSPWTKTLWSPPKENTTQMCLEAQHPSLGLQWLWLKQRSSPLCLWPHNHTMAEGRVRSTEGLFLSHMRCPALLLTQTTWRMTSAALQTAPTVTPSKMEEQK